MTVIFYEDDQDFMCFRENTLNSRKSSEVRSSEFVSYSTLSKRNLLISTANVYKIKNEIIAKPTHDNLLKYSVQVEDNDDRSYNFESAQLILKKPSTSISLNMEVVQLSLFSNKMRFFYHFKLFSFCTNVLSFCNNKIVFYIFGKFSFWQNFNCLLKWLQSKCF